MANIEAMISWFAIRQGKVTYSQNARMGTASYDCSSAVYFALIQGGFLPAGTMGNTDTLFKHLERAGWRKVPADATGNIPVKRGMIFIWGTEGASGGDFGHTGVFLDSNDTIIHCNAGHDGISVNDHDTIWGYNGRPPVTIYEYVGTVDNTNNETGVSTPKGEWLSESATFTAKVDDYIIMRGETTDSTPKTPIKLPEMGRLLTGQKVKYDAYMVDPAGYVWIRQPRANGKYGYVPTGETRNGKRVGEIWGSFA